LPRKLAGALAAAAAVVLLAAGCSESKPAHRRATNVPITSAPDPAAPSGSSRLSPAAQQQALALVRADREVAVFTSNYRVLGIGPWLLTTPAGPALQGAYVILRADNPGPHDGTWHYVRFPDGGGYTVENLPFRGESTTTIKVAVDLEKKAVVGLEPYVAPAPPAQP
jgi:hypothetical protein